MRSVILFLFLFCVSPATGQYPYVRKLNYPDQLPTQVVYDMLTDSKGYIWLGTDKGLFRFNGRTFVSIPFNSTSSKAVSYLQEDKQGTIWCMNFYNQLFSCQKDSLRKFDIDYSMLKGLATFNNVIIGPEQVWFHSFKNVYAFDKKSRKLQHVINAPAPPFITGAPKPYDPIIASVYHKENFYAFSNKGFLYSTYDDSTNRWSYSGQSYPDFRFISNNDKLIGLGIGFARQAPFEISKSTAVRLPSISLPVDIYIFQGICLDKNDYWLCTQSGAYQWNKNTGQVHCYLPNERVTDVVKDYQGNYWFSTLDNGVFVCPSLNNTLLKVYKDPLQDNFTKLATLPNGELLAGNSQGLMSKINLTTGHNFFYHLDKSRETEFITYDTTAGLIISNRGVFNANRQQPVELVNYSKGIARDAFGNLIIAVHNGVFILNDEFGSTKRFPKGNCRLYTKDKSDMALYDGRYESVFLRPKRALSVLASVNKDCFWIGYEDDLYEYHYDGEIRQVKDADGQPVIAKNLLQQPDGSLIIGTSTKGVMIFKEGKQVKQFTQQHGLSSSIIKKILIENTFIWVLTDEGLDRINLSNNTISNYLEEYGLNNTIINDFIIDRGRIIFATTTGILLRNQLQRYTSFTIKFPYLQAVSGGVEINNNAVLADQTSDINFHFEALHYRSSTALSYQYRLKGNDTAWKPLGNFISQLSFSRLAPGKYVFEVKATAGQNYKTGIRSFGFTVPKPFWQSPLFILFGLTMGAMLVWFSLRQWKKTLLHKQTIKEDLLKSQLVALRAQMNPHFLYNVLNTVQGLVYGNRKKEAGELLGNFSDLMRKTLQASDKQLLPLKDEIENIRLYLELEKARFEEGFSYELAIENSIDVTSVYVPSLLLQPFVENAVKHGLMHKADEKKVTIHFEKKGEMLFIMIDDNGIGRAHAMEINQRSKNKPFSFATVALTERMELFNRLYKHKIVCHIIDKFDERQQPTGTRIELTIPDYSSDARAL